MEVVQQASRSKLVVVRKELLHVVAADVGGGCVGGAAAAGTGEVPLPQSLGSQAVRDGVVVLEVGDGDLLVLLHFAHQVKVQRVCNLVVTQVRVRRTAVQLSSVSTNATQQLLAATMEGRRGGSEGWSSGSLASFLPVACHRSVEAHDGAPAARRKSDLVVNDPVHEVAATREEDVGVRGLGGIDQEYVLGSGGETRELLLFLVGEAGSDAGASRSE